MPATQHLIHQAAQSDTPWRLPPMSRSFGMITMPLELSELLLKVDQAPSGSDPTKCTVAE
jgi:hypothetical protein